MSNSLGLGGADLGDVRAALEVASERGIGFDRSRRLGDCGRWGIWTSTPREFIFVATPQSEAECHGYVYGEDAKGKWRAFSSSTEKPKWCMHKAPFFWPLNLIIFVVQ